MNNKMPKEYLVVGLDIPKFVDKRYLADRNLMVPLYDEETDAVAISEYMKYHEGWIGKNSEQYVRILERAGSPLALETRCFRLWR